MMMTNTTITMIAWMPVVTNRSDMNPSPQTDHAAHDMAPGNTRNIGLP